MRKVEDLGAPIIFEGFYISNGIPTPLTYTDGTPVKIMISAESGVLIFLKGCKHIKRRDVIENDGKLSSSKSDPSYLTSTLPIGVYLVQFNHCLFDDFILKSLFKAIYGKVNQWRKHGATYITISGYDLKSNN